MSIFHGITEHAFVTRIVGVGVALMIGIVTFLYLGAHTQLRMNAGNMYGNIPSCEDYYPGWPYCIPSAPPGAACLNEEEAPECGQTFQCCRPT